MKKIYLLIFCIILIFVSPKLIISQEYEQQFWLESKYAITDSFLIKIFLPPGYYQADTTHFPVLYLTDADAFWGAATDYSYFMDWDHYPIIVVGVGYGGFTEGWNPKFKRKTDLYSFGDTEDFTGAKLFLRFLREELIPKVESDFRIDSANRTLFGWSGGGMFATYALFQKPELFRNYLILGTPFHYRNKSWGFKLEEEYFSKGKDLPARVFMGVGEYDNVAFPSFEKFVQTLQGRKYSELKLKWEILKDMRHEYKTPVVLMSNGLEYFFQGTLIYTVMLKLIDEHGIKKAITEYHRLKNTAPNEYNFNENQLNDVGYFLRNSERIDEAIEIFKLNIESYPNSANTYDSLADGYMAAGDKNKAKEYVLKTLEMLPQDPYASEAEKEQLREWANEKLKKLK